MFDAIVLAGGSARRLDGADKPGLVVAGQPLLSHVLDAVADARRTVVVGPARQTRRPVLWCREDPPGGGPVAAIAAALPLVSAPDCLLLAADLPHVAPGVPVLLEAVTGHDAAVLLVGGRRNVLAAAWSTDALRAAVSRLGQVSGAAVRSLYAAADVVDVPDPDGWGKDYDTWSDLEHLEARE